MASAPKRAKTTEPAASPNPTIPITTMASGQPSVPPADRVRVVGAWAGSLEVDLDAWTVPMLRAEVARRAGNVEADRVGLISGGRVLRDDPPASLRQAGLKGNAKVLSSLTSPDRGKEIAAKAAAAKAEEEHANRLVRLWDAAKALSQRHTDGSFHDDDYNIDLENQSGEKVMFGSEDDMKALKMALMLHQKGKTLIEKKMYKEALDVLILAEEAFSLCNAKLIEWIDNVPMLQLDIVWCYFMLRDISRLEVAGSRLEKARLGFERAHGKDSTRLRVLNAHQADLAIYVRLELLEGVVAYHNGYSEKARGSLTSAQAKYLQLQVPDEAISMLMDMGYQEKYAKRALKMTGCDIQSSVELLCEMREKKIRREEENRKTQREILEQKTYGKTPMNKAVDVEKLKGLTTIGFEKCLAAEALRINENDAEKALDLLTDPEQNCILQRKILARRNRSSRGSSSSRAAAAAIAPVIAPAIHNSQAEASVSAPDATDGNTAPHAGDEQAANHDEDMGDYVDYNTDDEETNTDPVPVRDVAMEDELFRTMKGDALDDYDIDVSNEGQAIAEYLSLLESAASS